MRALLRHWARGRLQGPGEGAPLAEEAEASHRRRLGHDGQPTTRTVTIPMYSWSILVGGDDLQHQQQNTAETNCSRIKELTEEAEPVVHLLKQHKILLASIFSFLFSFDVLFRLIRQSVFYGKKFHFEESSTE